MLTYNQLVQIIVETASITDAETEREIENKTEPILFQNKPVKVITGLRRSGKSFILKRMYKQILNSGYPPENILFLNFEDDRLSNYLTQNDLRNIYELFISKSQAYKSVFLFLDEIQNIPHWEKFVRTIYDTTNHNIFITGSNSHLLSKEFAGVLGGRLLEFTVYPFSFTEFLDKNNVNYSNAFEKAKNKNTIRKLFDDYLNYGGLCEVSNLPYEARINYRKSLIDKIIINDITNRYNLHSIELLVNLLKYLERNTGNITSYRNIANLNKSNEHTVEQYISYLENAFIVNKLKKFSWKTNAIFDTNRKYYFIDNIFCHFADIEDKLENLCYQHLLRIYGEGNIFLGRDDKGKEIDFVVKIDDNTMSAFQICYELNDSNFDRENSSLQLFEKHMDKTENKLQIIYFYNNITVETHQNIGLVNVIDFLLG